MTRSAPSFQQALLQALQQAGDMMRTALLSLLALSVSSQGKEAGPVLMYCTHPVILGHLVMQYIGSASGDASHEGGGAKGGERGDIERILEGW